MSLELRTNVAKPRLCAACKTLFIKSRPLQRVCSPLCGLELARAKAAKAAIKLAAAERKADKVRKDGMKSKSQFAKEAQVVTNKYVRLRDAHLGCVSCDRPASWSGQWHASHFRSVGSAPGLRFNLWNIHKACSICNNYLSSNHIEYLPRLIAKIGIDKVTWLQCQNDVQHRDVGYFKRIKAVLGKRMKRMRYFNEIRKTNPD